MKINFFVYSIILIFFVLSFFIYPAFSQTPPILSIELSNEIYEEGDSIVIYGNVTTIVADDPQVTISIFFGNQSSLIQIAQLAVAQDGTFTHTVLAQGPQWQKEGQYLVRGQYGEGNVAEVSFEFFVGQSMRDTTDIFEVDAASFGTFDVEYTIRGGSINDMIVDSHIFGMKIFIETDSDGSITVNLPRKSIDAKKTNGDDDIFIILIDGIEVPYQEDLEDSKTRLITVEFQEEDSVIEIIGTFVIPEFGTFTYIVLAASIISILAISSRNNIIKLRV